MLDDVKPNSKWPGIRSGSEVKMQIVQCEHVELEVLSSNMGDSQRLSSRSELRLHVQKCQVDMEIGGTELSREFTACVSDLAQPL